MRQIRTFSSVKDPEPCVFPGRRVPAALHLILGHLPRRDPPVALAFLLRGKDHDDSGECVLVVVLDDACPLHSAALFQPAGRSCRRDGSLFI